MASTNISPTLEAAITAGRELAERREQADPDKVETVNVNGRSVAVDSKGKPSNERDEAWLRALAESTAQRDLDTTIRVANRSRDITAKLEPRRVTDKEADRAYRTLIKDGAYRAQTGQSRTTVLSDAIEATFGPDDTERFPEQLALAEQRHHADDQSATGATAAASVGRGYAQGRVDTHDGLVYDRRANAFRAPEHVTPAAGAARIPG
ncbi:hypothetical protein [Rhodococcoides corynebacterioides]|uniref:Uncharacterized protein n=1 Tax=Rhodococcoides corynebacterioides TaxID=53972 RepID=A0ABS7P3T9_9NOCA|nr:hypothetical protein [Rhodococcus corynebacterioides]MBY6367082.1 hypothetical protein [Rhodococcus corynebacterioides]MBY6407343.1 hypothetical protein [Rhodococcus corynebacterioides]